MYHINAPSLEMDLHELFNKELMPHFEAVYNFLYNYCRNDEDTQDLSQDTFARAYEAIGSYKPGTNAKAWLFTIARNTFINKYRKDKRSPHKVDMDSHFSLDEDDEQSPIRSYVDLRSIMFDSMMGDEMTRALDTLKPGQRTLIYLIDVEDYSYEEAAEFFNVPLGTIRSRLHRARNDLKAALTDYARSKWGIEDKRK